MNHGSSTREDSGATSNYRNEFENERIRENQYNDSRDPDYRSERLQHEQQSNNRSTATKTDLQIREEEMKKKVKELEEKIQYKVMK